MFIVIGSDFITYCFQNKFNIILLQIFSIWVDQFAYHANKIYKTCWNTYCCATTVGGFAYQEGRQPEGEGRWEKRTLRIDKDRVYRIFSVFYCCPSWYGCSAQTAVAFVWFYFFGILQSYWAMDGCSVIKGGEEWTNSPDFYTGEYPSKIETLV